jgi:hypothetical protein
LDQNHRLAFYNAQKQSTIASWMKKHFKWYYVLFALVAMLPLYLSAMADAEMASPPLLPLGGAQLEGWSGVEAGADGATLKLPGIAAFRYPQGPKGWYAEGFRTENDSTGDWRGYYGLQLDVQVPEGRTLKLEATMATPQAQGQPNYLRESHAICAVDGAAGWQRVTLPWKLFDYDQTQSAFLQFIQELRLTGKFTDGKADGEVRLKNVHLVLAPTLALKADVRGNAVPAGGTAQYHVTLANCTDSMQKVALSFQKEIWSTMAASVNPAQVRLAPGATATCIVSVQVPKEGVPPGGHESQTLLACGNGSVPLATLEFITARDVPRPSILHTPEGWAEVRAKVAKYDWAKKAQDEFVKAADAWQVPEASVPSTTPSTEGDHAYVFKVAEYKTLYKTTVAWELTGNKAYAEKIALFLRRLADEKTGYPSSFASMDQGAPQEGENWQNVAIAYDAILDAGVLSDDDRRSIDHTMRLYMETFESALTVGNDGNWNVAATTACLFSALAMGDLSATNRYLYGPSGFTDYVTKGIMDDGWWWECSSGYNFWVASELTQSALACQPWGIDLLHHEFPANFSTHTIVNPWALNPPYGISFEKWGPNHRNTRSVKQLWDAVPLPTDYRGITFGMNDGHEEEVGGGRLELAYYAFRDPLYAALIKQSPERDLIYGVPDLPADTPTPWLNSGYAENIGYALLRSQKENRQPKDQIQAVFKIGTQGGYHGHFDRASLDSIMRYGRSFWSPESIWWGYPNYMYKFYVQTSVAHNMVVVDQKQQEAVPSSQLLFFSGKMMQAVVQETNARWSDPPYLGMQYFPEDTPESQMRKDKQSIPPVTDRKYGELGPFSDRVLQRRFGIVTDDYIVVADYLKSDQPHTFDNLFQMKNFDGLDAADKKLLRHDAQFSADPHSAAQFITDCDWYQATAPAVGKFEFKFGPGADNSSGHTQDSEDGTLKIDVHSLWPPQQKIMLAQPPEPQGNQQWVTYDVSGDGKSLAKRESGVWILGAVDIDVSVQNVSELTLTVNTDGSSKRKSLFWANARLVTNDGKEIPLTGSPQGDNIDAPPKPGQDYYGGPIKIAGIPYADALPTQPLDAKKPAVIRVSLAGTNAVRFKATLGGDYPFGDETQRRKIFAVRSQGTEARFLTVLEPYEDKPMVKSAEAVGADKLRIELVDGRVQEITLHNFNGDGKNISADISESKNGADLRTETTSASSP